jgi:hypothetical protein
VPLFIPIHNGLPQLVDLFEAVPVWVKYPYGFMMCSLMYAMLFAAVIDLGNLGLAFAPGLFSTRANVQVQEKR